jgi:photoactive yellow protein
MDMTPKLDIISFDQSDIENVLAGLSPSEIDELPFGAIQLDAEGTVLAFSQREAQLTSRDPAQVIGRSFFNEVAPCTRSPEFYGRFRDGVEKGALGVVFDYVFDYKMNPTRVRVHMKKAIIGETYWVLVSRR